MLISHRYKFILLKTEKTASSSLLEIFRKIILDNDKLYSADPKVKQELLKQYGSLRDFSFDQGKGKFKNISQKLFGLHGHANAKSIRDYIGRDIFDDYVKITSERNPWDRQVSLFAHRSNKIKKLDITDFDRCMCSPIYNAFHYNKLNNWDIYSINNEVCADFVIRYEHLNSDLRNVLNSLGIDPDKYQLPHLRGQFRKKQIDYRELYSDRSRKLIKKWYSNEIDYFGYEF